MKIQVSKGWQKTIRVTLDHNVSVPVMNSQAIVRNLAEPGDMDLKQTCRMDLLQWLRSLPPYGNLHLFRVRPEGADGEAIFERMSTKNVMRIVTFEFQESSQFSVLD